MVLEHVIDTPDKWLRLAETFLTDGNMKAAKMTKRELARIVEPLIIQLDRELHEKEVHLSVLLAQAKSKRVAELEQFESAHNSEQAEQELEEVGTDHESEPEVPMEEGKHYPMQCSLYKSSSCRFCVRIQRARGSDSRPCHRNGSHTFSFALE